MRNCFYKTNNLIKSGITTAEKWLIMRGVQSNNYDKDTRNRPADNFLP